MVSIVAAFLIPWLISVTKKRSTSRASELLNNSEFIVISCNNWWGICILSQIVDLLQADGQPKIFVGCRMVQQGPEYLLGVCIICKQQSAVRISCTFALVLRWTRLKSLLGEQVNSSVVALSKCFRSRAK